MDCCELLLKSIAQAADIENPDITLKPCYTPGEGFLGAYHVATVRGKEKGLNLFVKQPPETTDEAVRETLRKIHLNEFLFYETIYPEFVKFEEDRDVKSAFKSVAKCYKTISERSKEIMVLDNMKMKGYKPYNKKEPLNDLHMKLILEEIAHFHAISFAFKDQRSKQFKWICDQIYCANTVCAKTDFDNTVEYITKYVKDGLDPKDFDRYKLYESYCGSIRHFLNSLDSLSKDFTVIIHGDLTNNNILFHYQDNQNPNIPTHVCIFDWQLTRVVSPVIDLSYLFYGMCSNKQMENVEYYLDFYYGKLCHHIRALGSDPHTLYPQKTFSQHWKTMARYGLALSFLVIKMMLTEPCDIMVDQNPRIKKTMLESLSYTFRNEKVFLERAKAIISHFIEKGYLEQLEG